MLECPPWGTWVVFCLMRHHARVNRVAAHLEASRLPEACDRHPIPGMPGWIVTRAPQPRGLGVHALSQLTGERVEFLATSNGPRLQYRSLQRFISGVHLGCNVGQAAYEMDLRNFPDTDLVAPAAQHLPEARLWRWVPSEQLIEMAIDELLLVGMVRMESDFEQITISDELASLAAAISELSFDDADVARHWGQLVGDVEISQPANKRAIDTLVDAHREWVKELSRSNDPGLLHVAIPVIAATLPAPEAVWTLESIIERVPELTSRVLMILEYRPETPPAYSAVRAAQNLVGDRAPTVQDANIIEYVAVRGLANEKIVENLITLLSFDANPEIDAVQGSLIISLLRVAPQRAVPFIRRHLRSPVEATARDVAALLVAIDQPWCDRELLLATREHDCRFRNVIAGAYAMLKKGPTEETPDVLIKHVAHHQRLRWAIPLHL